MTNGDTIRRLPAPAKLAQLLPGAIAAAGGFLSITALEQKLGRDSRMHVDGVTSDRDRQLVRETILDALRILEQRGSLKWDGETAELTEQGWAQADALGATPRMPDGSEMSDASDERGQTTIDLQDARQIVQILHGGKPVRGYLAEDANRFQGATLQGPVSVWADKLYPRAEVDGKLQPGGFYSTLRDIGVFVSAPVLLEKSCRVRLVGRVPEVRRHDSLMAAGTGTSVVGGKRSARRPFTLNSRAATAEDLEIVATASGRAGLGRVGRGGRQAGKASWERIVCEVLADLGGHAEWKTIVDAVGQRGEVHDAPMWRERTMEVIRNHTVGRGQGYFDVTEVADRTRFTLAPAGQKLASRRTVDGRAPTLSKYIATALAPDGDGRLTAFEVYALLHLAVELGKPAEAEALYHRLPQNFPDEDRYFMLPNLFDRAAELAGGDPGG